MTVVESERAVSDQELLDNLDSLLELYVTVRGTTDPSPDVSTPCGSGCSFGCECIFHCSEAPPEPAS